METADALVHVDAVTRKFPLDHSAVTALDHTSLRVEAGEFLAIAGPSGSGKSTLLNLIGCIDKPTSGRVFIDGVDTSQLSPGRTTALRREKIGFVFQTFNLISVFTAAENVEFPLLVQRVSAGERRARVTEALDSVGLAARAHHRPDLLSGGERQRVAVARAIVGRPALVLADEPTANLDTRNATQLIDLMRDLNRTLGLTFIFSTHFGVAKSMSVKVGDGLTILAVTADGALNGLDVQIVGIVNTGFKDLDDRYLRITLPSAQRLLQTDRVTNLVVGLDDTENTDSVAATLIPELHGQSQPMVIRKWIDLAAYYTQVRTLFSGIFLFLGIIVFFMVLMASINTLLMAMFERTREIGTMLAMGTPRVWIVALFMVEATLTGLFGAAAGVLGGNLLGVALNASGLHLPPPPGTDVPMAFKVLHVPGLMVGASLLVIVSLALASILPAIRASRLQIAEALAHV